MDLSLVLPIPQRYRPKSNETAKGISTYHKCLFSVNPNKKRGLDFRPLLFEQCDGFRHGVLLSDVIAETDLAGLGGHGCDQGVDVRDHRVHSDIILAHAKLLGGALDDHCPEI